MNKALIIFLLLISVSSCKSGKNTDSSSKPVLTVSIEPQRKLLEELAGERFEVQTLLASGSNPETFEPSMSVRRKAEESLAYFSTNAFPFEEKIKESLPSGVIFVDASNNIERLHGTHGHCHHHGHDCSDGDTDPHLWTSVKNMKKMALTMTKALCEIDSANAREYVTNLGHLSLRLDSLDAVIDSELMPLNNKSFAIWHPSLSYFSKDYGLNQIAVGLESKEMPASLVKKTIDEAKNERVKVFFFQKEYDSRQAQTINEAIGSEMVFIDPLNYNWEDELIKISHEIARP